MPINESSRKARERWPLYMDLEGIPRSPTVRRELLEQNRIAEKALHDEETMAQTKPVANNFAATVQGGKEFDINNPPRLGYVHKEFPKMLYHESGRTVKVETIDQFKMALRKGFQRKPVTGLDYSKISRGGIAPVAETGPVRETEFTPDQLDELDEAEAVARAEYEVLHGESDAVAAAEAEHAGEIVVDVDQNTALEHDPFAAETEQQAEPEQHEERAPRGRRR